MPITFGKVRQADGTIKDVRGIQLPYKMYRVKTKVVDPIKVLHRTQIFPGLGIPERRGGSGGGVQILGGGLGSGSGGNGDIHAMSDLITYNNDGGVYAVLDPAEFDNPSSLDDVNISSTGVGHLWNKLTFGFQFDDPSPHNFLVRWIVWSDKIASTLPDNSFTNERADFGGIITPPGTGAYVLEVGGLTAAGCVCDDTSAYVATQFRSASDLTGNGAFDNAVRCVYSSTVNTVGSSDPTFWFDNQPVADGNYTDPDEIEQLSNDSGSLLYTIKVDSATTSITPLPENPINITTGRTENSDASQVWYDGDDAFLNITARLVDDRLIPSVAVEMTSTVPTASIFSYRISTASKVNRPNVTQKIEIFRYSNSTWVQLDSHLIAAANTMYSSDIGYGGTIPLSQFVSSTVPKKVKMRYTYFGGVGSKKYTVSIDKMNWQITK